MAQSSGRIALPICCLLLVPGVGCYTVIKHPRLAAAGEVASADYTVPVTFGDDCRSCHAASTSGYHAIAVPPPRPEPSWRWAYYYDTPWWQSYYAPAADGSADEAKPSQRPFDRRHQSTQEEQAATGFAPAAQPLPPATIGAMARPATTDSSTTTPAPKPDSGKRRARRGSVRPNN